ncbi:YfiR family protein [Pseudoalteromonas sp. McH1-7]|uniref:YfiR family protein n=1 Tax=Pseudoalteromonas TaxID=53246 RepID=UPI000FFF64F4|nr:MULTISPECIES: YfiR family protein [Pseudoalteromonas]MDW7547342.1 YfiR family protein [Pseudoalteromonas peptidolytica]NUZ12581.1 YfiR family protein [Pseudoalteromonas sp. McH1-7]RXE95449.1 YfiR family protein [Pseudoalteromonas sp. PS5]USD28002.1 YfiR family protein [Pseudoalteromonas sp. SCSIO 43201]
MKRCCIIIICLFASMVLHAKTPDQVRSAFLYQMAKFIEFPDEDTKQSLIFCFYSLESGPASNLKNATKLSIRGKPITLIEAKETWTYRELSSACDVTYIDETNENDILSAWTDTIESNMLTVGESIEFLERGGIAALVQEGSKIRLYINKQALNKQYFIVRSRLLAVSKFHPN